VALADQNFRGRSAAIDQDQGGGILGAIIRMVIGLLLDPLGFAHFAAVSF